MLNIIPIQEGKTSKIPGIAKLAFIFGPDAPKVTHIRKSMFVLNTPNDPKEKI